MKILKIAEDFYINIKYIENFYFKDGEYLVEGRDHTYRVSKEIFDKLVKNSDIIQ